MLGQLRVSAVQNWREQCREPEWCADIQSHVMGNVLCVRNHKKYCHSLLLLQSWYMENWRHPQHTMHCPRTTISGGAQEGSNLTTAKIKSCSFVLIISLLLAMIWWLDGNLDDGLDYGHDYEIWVDDIGQSPSIKAVLMFSVMFFSK